MASAPCSDGYKLKHQAWPPSSGKGTMRVDRCATGPQVVTGTILGKAGCVVALSLESQVTVVRRGDLWLPLLPHPKAVFGSMKTVMWQTKQGDLDPDLREGPAVWIQPKWVWVQFLHMDNKANNTRRHDTQRSLKISHIIQKALFSTSSQVCIVQNMLDPTGHILSWTAISQINHK